MNLVVFGPGMETRPMPEWALRRLSLAVLTPVEELAQSGGHAVFGVPWVNPRGRGRAVASLADLLNDPVHLRRALEVALIAPRSPADAAVVAVDADLREDLGSARDWVLPRVSARFPKNRVLWWVFDPSLTLLNDSSPQLAEFLEKLNGLLE